MRYREVSNEPIPPMLKKEHMHLAATLTKRQKEILEYLKEYSKLRGYMPSFAEIGEQFGFSSLGTIYKHLDALRAKGYIKRAWNRPRAIELLELSTGLCPYCKRPMGESDPLTLSESAAEKPLRIGESAV